MSVISGIYKIVNSLNGKYYVGSSKNIFDRWKIHIRLLKRGKHHCRHLQFAWDKYGEKFFDFYIVETVLIENLLFIEDNYLQIAKLDKDMSYNSVFSTNVMDEETKEKIRRSIKRKRESGWKPLRINPPKRGKDHPSYGKKASDETKLKISLNNANTDKRIYTFLNVKTGECFSGLRKDFIKKYNLSKTKVSAMISKEKYRHSHRNWKLAE